MRHEAGSTRFHASTTPGEGRVAARLAPLLALAALLPLTAACGGGEQTETAETPAAGTTAAPRAMLVPGTRSTQTLAGATARIEQPKEGAIVMPGTVPVKLAVDQFALGEMTPGAEGRGIAVSAKGQHVHLILDDRPYVAVYDVSSPVALDSVGPGRHALFAFPSRAWHESVKSAGALAVTTFTAAEPGGSTEQVEGPAAAFDRTKPFLVYSRPKGTYSGADADSVMVDFYLGNVDLSPDGYKVRVTVDSTLMGLVDRWAPWYLLDLPDGQHQVTLELIDADGVLVPGPFNRTTRTITIERNPGG